MLSRAVSFPVALGLLLGTVSPAHAQFAVIDVASLSELVSEAQLLEQQLTEAQTEYQSISGARGMGRLLAGAQRNYLPPDWPTLQAALRGSGGYPRLAADLQSATSVAAVLSPQQLASLSPAANAQLQARRQTVALLQSLSHESLANSSSRFSAVQQLIDAIAQAPDQKAILELQARIAAEQGMLQNEQTKQQVLYQGVQAQDWANAQRMRELALAGHGEFQNRFQPRP